MEQKQNEPTSLIVSFVFHDDPEDDLMVVGSKRMNQSAEILNAKMGVKVRDIYDLLLKKESEDER